MNCSSIVAAAVPDDEACGAVVGPGAVLPGDEHAAAANASATTSNSVR